MAELDEALMILASWLDRDRVPYMVIGGFAVTIWGEPRFTRDLDVTILVPAEQIRSTINRICSAFTALVTDAMKFVADTRVLPIMINSVPVDLIFAALPYEEAAIARARTINLKNGAVRICAPEDLILHKIVSPRPRDHEDIEGVFRYRHVELDYDYLDPRVEELADALADRSMLDWYRALRERWKEKP
jgi:hypothetical protein